MATLLQCRVDLNHTYWLFRVEADVNRPGLLVLSWATLMQVNVYQVMLTFTFNVSEKNCILCE